MQKTKRKTGFGVAPFRWTVDSLAFKPLVDCSSRSLVVTGSRGQSDGGGGLYQPSIYSKIRHAGLSLGTEYAAINELAFKGSEKALRHRVVKTVAYGAH